MLAVLLPACYFFMNFFFFIGFTAFFLWMPLHCEKKMESRKKSFTRRERVQVWLVVFVGFIFMSVENLPYLFRDFKAVQWPQLFQLLF